jgi:hypothetical protein
MVGPDPVSDVPGYNIGTVPHQTTGTRDDDLARDVSNFEFDGWLGIVPVPIHPRLESSKGCFADVSRSKRQVLMLSLASGEGILSATQ